MSQQDRHSYGGTMNDTNGQNNLDRLAGLQGGAAGGVVQPQHSQPAQVPPPGNYYPQPNYFPQQPVFYTKPQNGMGVAALVLGIIGMVPFPVTGFWCSLLAIIFGAIGRKRVRQGTATNKVMATWGLWLGIVGMGIQVLLGFSIAFGSG